MVDRVAATRVAITGANGFVGRALSGRLVSAGNSVTAISRRPSTPENGAQAVFVSSFDAAEDLRAAFRGAECVFHLAARVHVMHDTASDSLAEYRRVNVAGTLSVARAAVASGARRLVFLSSIKVNGERTEVGRPFTNASPAAPADPYGVSKHEAELALRSLAAESGIELVIVRPVLVYGAGVKGNFRSMMKWVKRGAPLPLGAVDNRRSLVGIDNLTDLLSTCIDSPAAAGQTFLVSDGQDISTSDLIRMIAAAMKRPARLMGIPIPLLRACAALVGKHDAAVRLLGSLQVDISETRRTLRWDPPFKMDEQVEKTVSHFLAS